MTPGTKAYTALQAKALQVGRKLNKEEIIAVLDEQWGEGGANRGEIVNVKAAQPRSLRSRGSEDAEAIYAIYPRREGRGAGLKAIELALKNHPRDMLVSKTQEYAAAVARWPRLYRYSHEGRDLVPMPSTWFSQQRFLDDSKEWTRVGGAPAPKPTAAQTPAPEGWISFMQEKQKEWERENEGYEGPARFALQEKNFFACPQSWQAQCRVALQFTQPIKDEEETQRLRLA